MATSASFFSSSGEKIPTFLRLASEHQNDPEKAVAYLFSCLSASSLKEFSDYSLVYNLLLRHLSRFVQDPSWIDHVQLLLDLTSHLPEEQAHLAKALADICRQEVQHADLRSYEPPLRYYAKALLLADTPENHRATSRLFFKIISDTFKENLEQLRSEGRNKDFEELLKKMDRWKEWGATQEDQNTLCLQAQEVIRHIPESSRPIYRRCLDLIEEQIDKPFTPSSFYITQRYRQKLAQLRKIQGNVDVRVLQKTYFQKWQAFFQETLLADAFTILGPPPCGYDMRAMGSLAREEPCPYSDLEYFILIEKDTMQFRNYFTRLSQLLWLQITTLGEATDPDLFVFTALGTKQRLGLHVDTGGNPAKEIKLISNPYEMALHVSKKRDDLTTFENTPLKTSSLSTNDPSLFETYCRKIKEGDWHKTRSVKLLRHRLTEYKQLKDSTQINVKKNFIAVLHYTLSDLALYFQIFAVNTLDIVDALVQQNVFTEESGALLKEAISKLYLLRLKLHAHYGEQREEVYFQPQMQGYVVSNEEQLLLKKIRHLVLEPLYHRLNDILGNQIAIDKILYQISLSQEKFEEILVEPHSPASTAALESLLIHLAENKAPFSIYEKHFRQLSQNTKTDHLRQTYLGILKNKLSKAEIEALALIPNRSGYRFAFLEKAKELEAEIFRLTSVEPPSESLQVRVIAPNFVRYLNAAVAQVLLGNSTDIQRTYPGSAHPVSSIGELHFKQKPTHPLMEYAIHNLFFRIAGFLTPATQLVRFEVTHQGTTHAYPVLISTTIPGTTLKESLKKSIHFSSQAWIQWTWLVLSSILTRPGDGLLSNYLLDEQLRIYCIDNDISFVEPVAKGKLSNDINFCSSLFCLFPDRPLHFNVLKEFCSLDVDAILNSWIDDVIAKEQEYIKLFTKEELQTFYEENPSNSFKATILFREGALATLNLQFTRLQNHLLSIIHKNKICTSLGLLKQLINLHESLIIESASGMLVYKAYDKAKTIPLVNDKLKQITARKQERSMTSLQSDIACLGKVPSWQEIEKLALFAPSKAKEELLSTLLKRSAEYISTGNIQGKKILKASFKEMKRGNEPDIDRQILVLHALIYLASIDEQKPASITLQHCRVLDSKTIESFLHDKIEYLDLRYCIGLRDKDIETIQKKCPEIKELYLTGCSGLKNIQVSGFIASAPLMFSKLQILECSKCENLQTMQITGMSLQRLEANKNPQLKKVDLTTLGLAEVDFSESPQRNVNYHWIAFGKNAWEKYLGDIGPQPPLPEDIHHILQSPCPFWQDKKIYETHLLVLIPQTVNGNPLTLRFLETLVKNTKQGATAQYYQLWPELLRDYLDNIPKDASYWVLFTKDLIPNSKDYSFSDHPTLISHLPFYRIPKVLEAATCILVEHVKTRNKLYDQGKSLCQEKVGDGHLCVGSFGRGGLSIDIYYEEGSKGYIGLGGLRHFNIDS